MSAPQIQVIVYATATLSGISALLVLTSFVFILTPKSRTFATKLVAYLALADLIGAISRFMTYSCRAYGALNIFTTLSSFSWMAAVALYQYVVINLQYKYLSRFEVIFHIVCWGLPAIDTIILSSLNRIGSSTIWCWITIDHQASRVLGYYVWFFLAVLIIVASYVAVIFELRKRLRAFTASSALEMSSSRDNIKRLEYEFILYMSVLFFARSWTVIHRIYDLATPDHTVITVLMDAHAVGSGLQGFINAVFLYFNNQRIQNRLKMSLEQRFNWKFNERLVDEPSETPTIEHFTSDVDSDNETLLKPKKPQAKTRLIRDVTYDPALIGDGDVIDARMNDMRYEAFLVEYFDGIISVMDDAEVSKNEYLTDLNVYCVTWNAGNSTTLPTSLVSLLQLPDLSSNSGFQGISQEESDAEFPDIIAVGVQELSYDASDWENLLLQTCMETRYMQVESVQLVQMHLTIFMKKKFSEMIDHVVSSTSGTGFGDIFGNKGGVGIGFSVGNLRVAFVNTHLAAHQSQENFDERLEDIAQIAESLVIGEPEIDFTHQFHALFWMGDMNWRLSDFNDVQSAIGLSDSGNFSQLLEHDEFWKVQQNQQVLCQFDEQEITFPPTYKFSTKRKGKYEDTRVPAWCDRIVYQHPSHPAISVQPISYSSMNETIASSDHRAVYGNFSIECGSLWQPEPYSKWRLKIKNLRVYMRRGKNAGMFSGFGTQPYLSFSAPFLNPTQRTPLASVVNDGEEMCEIVFSGTLDIKLRLDETTAKNMGNHCLWVALRDENLLGDVDVLAAAALALCPTKFAFVNFEIPLTRYTGLRGLMTGAISFEKASRALESNSWMT